MASSHVSPGSSARGSAGRAAGGSQGGPARKRPTGRRAGDSGTREAILAAGRKLFAERGFDSASVRAIATEAGVDAALIRHFFGDKDGLFAAVAADRTTFPERMAAAMPGPPETLAKRLVTAYLDLWEDGESGPVLRAIFRTAVTSERSSELLVDLLATRLRASPDAPVLSKERSEQMALAASHLLGIAVARYVAKIPPLSTMPREAIVRKVAPVIQGYLAQSS